MNHKLILTFCILILTSATSCMTHSDYSSLPPKKGSLQEVFYTPDSCRFSLWAPTADSALVNLYDYDTDSGKYTLLTRLYMRHDAEDGSWSVTENGDLKGRYYTFQVWTDGRWLEETPGIFATAVGVNGRKAAIIDMDGTDPEGWDQDRRPPLASFADIVVYEMHLRDFSASRTSGIPHKGKFASLTAGGLRSAMGEPSGLDHLKGLGITHVHLLPSFDFASIDESYDNLYSQHPVLYNWGYDPLNYNVPEGSYSHTPDIPENRVREFKEMVQALHKAGIRVIMDVVYNHVSDAATSAFERTVPGYFFRTREDGSLADGSGCGNETASEREMMRRYMVESVCWWAEEYHIDGFRFDLMGIHDIGTMNAIRQALDRIDSTIFIYGEGWAASAPMYEADALAMKANIWQMPRIAAFSDELRDALRGPFNDDTATGFLGGAPDMEESVKFGIAGGIYHPQIEYSFVNYSDTSWAAQPTQMISYVSCHDDMCLRDRLTASIPDASEAELLQLDKLAQTAVFTSQGVPFIFAGEEMYRTKHGVHNSYNSPDSINAIDWNNKSVHKDLYEYYRGLIALRKAHPAFRLADADLVRRHLEFMDTPEGAVAFRLKEHAGGDSCEEIVVILNSRKEAVSIDIPSDGREYTYTVYCSDGKISTDGLGTLTGPTVSAGPRQALIIGRS